jgi:hypothetical protein
MNSSKMFKKQRGYSNPREFLRNIEGHFPLNYQYIVKGKNESGQIIIHCVLVSGWLYSPTRIHLQSKPTGSVATT